MSYSIPSTCSPSSPHIMSSWILNCAANLDTNGVDLKLTAGLTHVKTRRNMAKGDVVDNAAKSAVGLPSKFEPKLKTAGSNDALQSFILPDKKTGVVRFESLRYPAHVPADVVTNSKLFVGSFASGDFDGFQRDVAKIMQRFKDANLTQLIVDVTNNNGASLQWGGEHAAEHLWQAASSVSAIFSTHTSLGLRV